MGGDARALAAGSGESVLVLLARGRDAGGQTLIPHHRREIGVRRVHAGVDDSDDHLFEVTRLRLVGPCAIAHVHGLVGGDAAHAAVVAEAPHEVVEVSGGFVLVLAEHNVGRGVGCRIGIVGRAVGRAAVALGTAAVAAVVARAFCAVGVVDAVALGGRAAPIPAARRFGGFRAIRPGSRRAASLLRAFGRFLGELGGRRILRLPRLGIGVSRLHHGVRLGEHHARIGFKLGDQLLRGLGFVAYEHEAASRRLASVGRGQRAGLRCGLGLLRVRSLVERLGRRARVDAHQALGAAQQVVSRRERLHAAIHHVRDGLMLDVRSRLKRRLRRRSLACSARAIGRSRLVGPRRARGHRHERARQKRPERDPHSLHRLSYRVAYTQSVNLAHDKEP